MFQHRSAHGLARVLVLAGAICASGFAHANVIINPGFEDPITFDGAPFVGFWEGFSAGGASSVANSMAMPRSGSQSAEFIIDEAPNLFAGVLQDVAITAGNLYDYSGWHKLIGDAGGIEIRIEWRNSGSNTEISRTSNFTPVLTSGADYEMFSLTGLLAPAGADTARVVYAIQSFGGAISQDVFLDDVSFMGQGAEAAAPIAATLALMGGGLLGLLGFARRRRS
ncbi:MAG: hypothetical protein KDG50_04780 [Chromatiales bacterium]|nr:hypothetical protein [Chromatiales bacterium]